MKARDVYGIRRDKVYGLHSGKSRYRVRHNKKFYLLYFLNEGVYSLNTTGLIYLFKILNQVSDYDRLVKIDRELLYDFLDGNIILKSNDSDIPGKIQYNGYLNTEGNPNLLVTSIKSMLPRLKKSV